MNSDDFTKRAKFLNEEADNILMDMHALTEESQRVVEVAHNSDAILSDIEAKFSAQTGIENKKDMTFLFLATGLLCAKWVIMKNIAPLETDFSHSLKSSDKRLNSTEMGDIDTKGKSIDAYKKTLETVKKNREKLEEKLTNCTDESERKKILNSIKNNEKRQEEINKILQFFKRNPEIANKVKDLEEKREKLLSKASEDESKYRTVTEIFTRPVPYDAMNPVSEKVNLPINLAGTNHHAYTLGHDPVAGWIFGTMNIMSRSITFNLPLWPTFWVVDEGNKIKCPTGMGIISILFSCVHSLEEDDKRLPASVFRHGLHMISDKFGKTGLPINLPFRSAEQAQELIEQGWNSEEATKFLKKVMKNVAKDSMIIGVQFILSYLINQIIKALHLMMYDETEDGDIKVYEVRTRQILMIANTISTTSNFAYVVITKQLNALDIGGAIETIHRIVSDSNYINKMKEEFIENSFRSIVMGDEEALYE